jgi:protein SDA1
MMCLRVINHDLRSHLLDADLRRTLCQALILLRNRNMLTSTSLLELFFQLFRCPDKPLREMLYKHIVSDVRRLNEGHKNAGVNKTLQNFMYSMLTDDNKIAAKMSLDVMIELHHKQVWNDVKTVNVIATACFSPITKIMVAALKFFLGTDVPEEEDEDSNKEKGPQEEYDDFCNTIQCNSEYYSLLGIDEP